MASIELGRSLQGPCLNEEAQDFRLRIQLEAERRRRDGEPLEVISAWIRYEFATMEQAMALREWRERLSAADMACAAQETAGRALDAADEAKGAASLALLEARFAYSVSDREARMVGEATASSLGKGGQDLAAQ